MTEGLVPDLPAKVFDILEKESGRFVISHNRDRDNKREWLVGIEFGEEDEDSDMAAGAAYGVGATLAEALKGMTDDLG